MIISPAIRALFISDLKVLFRTFRRTLILMALATFVLLFVVVPLMPSIVPIADQSHSSDEASRDTFTVAFKDCPPSLEQRFLSTFEAQVAYKPLVLFVCVSDGSIQMQYSSQLQIETLYANKLFAPSSALNEVFEGRPVSFEKPGVSQRKLFYSIFLGLLSTMLIAAYKIARRLSRDEMLIGLVETYIGAGYSTGQYVIAKALSGAVYLSVFMLIFSAFLFSLFTVIFCFAFALSDSVRTGSLSFVSYDTYATDLGLFVFSHFYVQILLPLLALTLVFCVGLLLFVIAAFCRNKNSPLLDTLGELVFGALAAIPIACFVIGSSLFEWIPFLNLYFIFDHLVNSEGDLFFLLFQLFSYPFALALFSYYIAKQVHRNSFAY